MTAPPRVEKGNWPDPLGREDGGRIGAPEQWPARAGAWRDLIVGLEYGGMPPPPESVSIEPLCRATVKWWPEAPNLHTYRILCSGGARPVAIGVRLLVPASGQGPFPAIAYGDGCWWPQLEKMARAAVSRGFALAIFNRTEAAADLGVTGPGPVRLQGGLYDAYPGLTFGALSAWAWAFHRVVDLLLGLDAVDPARIAVSGHSRGGKAALLAAATDSRIAMVNDNASGAGGGAAFRHVGAGGETLRDLLDRFPYWFGPGLRPYADREESLPFDQHCLLASLAPRPLLLTYARGDPWSNPEGMILSAKAAGGVYRFLGFESRIAIRFRAGPHRHAPEDWRALLDFLGHHGEGRPLPRGFLRPPFRARRRFGTREE